MKKAGRFIMAAGSVMVLMAGVCLGTPQVKAVSKEPVVSENPVKPVEDKTTESGLCYQVNDEKNVTVTGYEGTSSKVRIPASIEGYPVVNIAKDSFIHSEIAELTIPESVVKIEEGAIGKNVQAVKCYKGSVAYRYAKKQGIEIVKQDPVLNHTAYVLNPKKTVSLKVMNPTGKTTWTSSNKKVATISQKGLVKAVKTGTVTMTATNNGHKTSCKITVTDMKLDKAKAKVTVGKNVTLKLLKAGKSKVTWKSSDRNVASVNKSGVVTAKRVGTATITASCKGITFTSMVTVLANEKVLYTQDINISDLAENTGFIGIKKISYQGSDLKFSAYAYNNYAQKLANAETITITLYDKGKKIGEQTYKNCALNVNAHSKKKMTFIMKNKNVKVKNMDLRTSKVKAKVTVGMCSFGY